MSIVTLEEVKAGLRIDEDYEDGFIESITIPSIRESVLSVRTSFVRQATKRRT